MNYRSKQKEKQILEKVYYETRNGYGAGVYHDGIRYRRYKAGDSRAKYYKKRANRVTRQAEVVGNGCSYKKNYDLKDDLF